jgi:arylformamidase
MGGIGMAGLSTTRSWINYSPEDLEYHYNPRATNPDSERYGEVRAGINQQGLEWPGRKADIAYSAGGLENLDIYLPANSDGPHPVHIFIHGGYWRSREKEDFGFIGAALANQGLLAVVINYPLCPAVTLDDVVASTREAFTWVCNNIADHGGDPSRITISGHSAGAHLGAAIIAHDWPADCLGDGILQGAVLVSGIYDPAPAQHLSISSEIGLTPEIAARQNFANKAPKLKCPVTVIVGGGEPAGWIDQSADYAGCIRSAGFAMEYIVSGKENHFSIQDQFCDTNSDVLSSIMKSSKV